jgi:integrase/recombinase XerD
MTTLSSGIERFLAHGRALGFGYRREEAFLEEIDRLACSRQESILSEALVREYLSRWSVASRSNRLTIVRVLARSLAIDEPRTFIPPARFLGIRRRRPVIRVFSLEEARRFLAACDVLPEVKAYAHGLVHGIALRTLLLTGLRRGELLGLRDDDVDLSDAVLNVRHGKFGKSRLVPLAPDLVVRLRTYREAVLRAIAPCQPTRAFFPRPCGQQPLAIKTLYSSFRQALEIAGIKHLGRGQGPRLHDLRHSFAVLRLLRWYETGADLSVKLPLLATYLGHIGLTSTQVYLHLTEDFASELVRRQRERFGDLITEVVE